MDGGGGGSCILGGQCGMYASGERAQMIAAINPTIGGAIIAGIFAVTQTMLTIWFVTRKTKKED